MALDTPAETQLTTMFAESAKIPIVPILHTALLKFSTAVLVAAEMPLWLNGGLKFLQRAWNWDDEQGLRFSLRLNGCLAELGWGGWKLVALPILMKKTVAPAVLERASHSRQVLGLLAELKRAKRLSVAETDIVWREQVEKIAFAKLDAWDKNAEGSVRN